MRLTHRIWLLAFWRRDRPLRFTEKRLVNELRLLIEAGQARLAGPVRQELLSGLRDSVQFEKLRHGLRALPDEPMLTEDYERAASISKRCRAAGVAGSAVDFLLTALALGRGWAIFTTDKAFARYAKVNHLRLHRIRGR